MQISDHLLYACYTWITTVGVEYIFERNVLRKIMDSETQTWERITNERLKYLCGKGDMVAFIKDVRPEWADYVRRADNNLIKTVL